MDDESVVETALKNVLKNIEHYKPNDRSEKDRIYAVTITELQKILAYFSYYTQQLRDAEDEE